METPSDRLCRQKLDLAALATRNRLRRLEPRRGIDFSSNDYLGLGSSERLRNAVVAAAERGVPVGSGGSRLLRGNDPEHEALEREAAAFFGVEACLLMGSGYSANAALLATLPVQGDFVIHDELVHASAHEGIRLGRAEALAAPHNDVDFFEDAIRGWRRRGGSGTAWMVVESLYSMNGDIAALDGLAEVAERHHAMLVVDEAHATGVLGRGGRGLAHGLDGRANVVTLKTCGKALGCEGALVCGSALIRDVLVARARPFIFSTAPSPLMAAAIRESLRAVEEEAWRRERLAGLRDAAVDALVPLGAVPTDTHIMPLIFGDDERTMRIAAALREDGLDVRGIRPPTVPAGTSRLRISLTLHVDEADIVRLAQALAGALR